MLSAVALVWASGQPVETAPPPSGPDQSAQSQEPSEGQTITVTARTRNDPIQGANAVSFDVTQAVDNKLVGPAAETYKKLVPKPARAGLHNVIRNLGEPVVALNFLLQLKPGKAAETLGRFGINSTLGIAGLVDVAKGKPFNLPHRHNGFANTLGYYGVGTGPYLYLPFIGSTSLRDVVGGAVDGVILPVGIGAPFNKPYYTIPNGTIRSLDRRVEFDCQIKALQAADDPYAATRAYYLKKRQAEIDALHGRGKGPELLEQCKDQLSGSANAVPVLPPPAPIVPAAPEPAPGPPPATPG
ncbi:MAG: VacJ family lipoprotein [Sphingomonadaceae bacterium]